MSVGMGYRSKAMGRRAGTLGRSSHVVVSIKLGELALDVVAKQGPVMCSSAKRGGEGWQGDSKYGPHSHSKLSSNHGL